MSKYKIILLVIFILALVWSGIRPPASQQYWLLENSPLFLAILVFVLLELYFKLKISNFSYTLIVLYLILPLIASHYGVTGVSFGEILGNWIGSTRNMYDRLTHFAFGFLGFYPVYEFVVSVNKKESLWNYYIPLETIMMFLSLGYENASYFAVQDGIAANRRDNYYFARVGPEWRVKPWCNLSSFYEFSKNDSTGIGSRSFTRNRVGVQANFSF